jgi:UDP:flavonoid glycosyltransferase YjiC (YdhE family)
MARFLFCSLASPGFLYPAIGLGVSLRRRGHTVAFLTDPVHNTILDRVGLIPVNRAEQSGAGFRVELWGKPLVIALQVKQLENAAKMFHPDVLVGQQLTLAPLIVRERLKIPAAIIGMFTALWPKWPPYVDSAPPDCISHKNWLYEEMLSLYNEARSLFRLSPYPFSSGESPFTGDLFMLRSVQELEGDISHLPEQVHLVSSCLWDEDQKDEDLENWLNGGGSGNDPLVYVQQGKFFEKPHFWKSLITGAGDFRLRFVASVGRMDCELGQLPSNFFVRSHISQRQVLQRARVMVASATSTVILGALTEGVPSLLIPGGGEQPIAAERCRAFGAARVIQPTNLSAEILMQEIKSVLNDAGLTMASQKAAKALAAIDSLSYAAHLLEALAQIGTPLTRQSLGTSCISTRASQI